MLSFPRIEEKIFKVIFDAISKMSSGLNTFSSMQLDIPNTCDPTDKACMLVTQFGSDYLQCVQKQINTPALSFSICFSFGETWLPPSLTSWGIAVSCSTLDCWNCVLGLNSGVGTIKDILKLFMNDFISPSGDEATRKTCPNVLACSGGTWDSDVCACRCSGAFLSTDNGCEKCPGPSGNVCNGKGACYNTDTGPACCCTGGITTPDCS